MASIDGSLRQRVACAQTLTGTATSAMGEQKGG
jgi:hypothetical protein